MLFWYLRHILVELVLYLQWIVQVHTVWQWNVWQRSRKITEIFRNVKLYGPKVLSLDLVLPSSTSSSEKVHKSNLHGLIDCTYFKGSNIYTKFPKTFSKSSKSHIQIRSEWTSFCSEAHKTTKEGRKDLYLRNFVEGQIIAKVFPKTFEPQNTKLKPNQLSCLLVYNSDTGVDNSTMFVCFVFKMYKYIEIFKGVTKEDQIGGPSKP